MTLSDTFVATVLGTWFVLSVVNQFPGRWLAAIKSRDVFGLLPIWTFFAPNPGQSDYHCVYRDKLTNGSLTSWREVELTEARRAMSFLWNPEKRSKKVLSDVVVGIINSTPKEGTAGREIMLSLPYLLLLNVVCQEPWSRDAACRQFVLLETFGFEPTAAPRVLLRSEFHSHMPSTRVA